MIRKAKSSSKIFISNKREIKNSVVKTLGRVADIVGGTLGPGGRLVIIESDIPGIPHAVTKDGVTVFKSLGASSSVEHVIIEAARDAATRTASEAGDGTTTTTILSHAFVSSLFEYCEKNPKVSPQRLARKLSKTIKETVVPLLRAQAIEISEENLDVLKKVATISANGDTEMAEAVMSAFDLLGYSDSSHVTIKQKNGQSGYEVGLIEGFPLPIGLEESVGKFFNTFINDQSNQRCILEKPKFLLYDGQLTDLITIQGITDQIGQAYNDGNTEMKNLVVVANGFSDSVLTALSYNFLDPNTINVVPIRTPEAGFLNAQTHLLYDLSAFTGARVFGMKDSIATGSLQDLGQGMESFEAYRFRSTLIGEPDSVNIEVRAEELQNQSKNAESKQEKMWLEERLGKLTSGIAKITILGGSGGELKEAHDRCEDAVLACRSSLRHGALPGGGRSLLNAATHIHSLSVNGNLDSDVAEVITQSLIVPIQTLLTNAGNSEEEIGEIVDRLISNPTEVFDIQTRSFGSPEDLGLFDSLPAVEQALLNSSSVASIMGTLGGVVVFPRDEAFERQEAAAEAEFGRILDNPNTHTNEANERP